MKVDYVNQYALTPDIPGGTRHFELAKSMQKFGIDTKIWASDLNLATRTYYRRPSFRDKSMIVEVFEGVPFQWLYTNAYQRNGLSRISNMLNFSIRVFRQLTKQPKPHIIIGSSPHLFAALAAQRAARYHNVPFVFEIRDIWPKALGDVMGKMGFLAQSLQPIAQYLYANSDHFISLAQGTTLYLQKNHRIEQNKITYIPNGIIASKFDIVSPIQRKDIRKKYKLPPEKYLCVYAGTHGRANGLETLILAANELKTNPYIAFVLVGDGPTKQSLMAKAQELQLSNIYFCDPIPKKDIPQFLGSLDLGLLILRDAEVFQYGISPQKLFDYWAARLPVIATVQGDIGQLIDNVAGGRHISPNNPSLLKETILAAFNNKNTYSEMAQSGYKYVCDNFEWTKLSEKLATALQQVAHS